MYQHPELYPDCHTGTDGMYTFTLTHATDMYTHVYVTRRMISHFTIRVSLYMCNSFDLECHPKVDVFVGTFNKIYLKKAKPLQRGGEGVSLKETLGSGPSLLFLSFLCLLTPMPAAVK